MDAGGTWHAFLPDVDGPYTTLDVPGALFTFAYGICASGQIVGYYVEANGTPHGFRRDVDDSYTTLDVPGERFTFCWGINDAGQVVRYYNDAGNTNHGFLLDVPFGLAHERNKFRSTTPIGLYSVRLGSRTE